MAYVTSIACILIIQFLLCGYGIKPVASEDKICRQGFSLEMSNGNCSFKLLDATKGHHQMKNIKWSYGTTRHIYLMINDSKLETQAVIHPHDWLETYLDPNGPLYYVSWRADFKVLSFGLLDQYTEKKQLDLQVQGNIDNCTIDNAKQDLTSFIVKAFIENLKDINVFKQNNNYENVNLCFVTKFEWFQNSPWFILKKHFGIPFQEFGYKCCHYYNGSVCCDDKLKRIEGYRLVPYIISIFLFCYTPFFLVNLGNIIGESHPANWHNPSETLSNTSRTDNTMISMFDNVLVIDDPECSNKHEPSEILKFLKPRIVKVFFIMLVPLGVYIELLLYVSTQNWRSQIRDIVKHDILFGFTLLLGDPLNNTFLPFLGGPLVALLIFHCLGFIIVILPDNFGSILAGGAKCIRLDKYIDKRAAKGCESLKDYKKVHRILKTGIYLLFNSRHWKNLKHEKCRYSFLIKLWGVLMVIILLLPVFPFLFITFVGCIKFYRTKLFGNNEDKKNANEEDESKIPDNKTCKDKTKTVVCICLKSLLFVVLFGSLIIFMYIFSVIVSYTIYFIVYITYFMCLALVTSPKETSTYVLFIFGGIVFLIQTVRDMLHFYKDIFELTIEACKDKDSGFQKEFLQENIKEEKSIVYIKKKLVVYVLEMIRPFYVSVGDIVVKVSSVILMFTAIITFLTIYNTKISDVLEHTTAVITSSLPLLIQSQMTLERPKIYIIKYFISEYEAKKTDSRSSKTDSANNTSGPSINKNESVEKEDNPKEAVDVLNKQTGPMNNSVTCNMVEEEYSPSEHTNVSTTL